MKVTKERISKTDLAYENWNSKYQYGEETEMDTQRRVAKALASVEKNPEEWEEKFLRTLVNFKPVEVNGETLYSPEGLKVTMGGRITANLGTNFKKATPWNCFINGPVSNAEIKYVRKNTEGNITYPVKIKTSDSPDDLNNIFLTILEQAKTLASEGGYGINFDFIRPRGTLIKGIGIRHPGVVSYMKIWDAVSECIVKGDNDGYNDIIKNYLQEEEANELQEAVKKMARKGAMMGALSCFSENTEILTDLGWLPILEVIERVEKGEKLKCIDEKGNKNFIKNPFKKEKEPIYELETVEGEIIEVTGDHKFEVRNIKTGKVYLKAVKDINPEEEEFKIIEEV